MSRLISPGDLDALAQIVDVGLCPRRLDSRFELDGRLRQHYGAANANRPRAVGRGARQ